MNKFFIFLFFALVIGNVCGQATAEYVAEIKAYQDTLNAEFRNPETSPLETDDLLDFSSLEFFPIDSNYKVTAQFIRTPKSKPFKMKTTTDRLPVYSQYALAKFEIDGVAYELEIYQNHDMRKSKEYADYLFLPFYDKTNGDESYGGGRYISLSIPPGDTIEIDFNKAYNPYCVYNKRFSCPLIPRVNRLNTRIEAGVMDFVH